MDKSILASKTFWFNAVTIIIGTIEVISKTYPIPPEVMGLVIGIGNVILRLFTIQPVTPIGFGKFKIGNGK